MVLTPKDYLGLRTTCGLLQWLILLPIATLLLQGSALARLGETQDQAEARYGLPKSEKTSKFGRPLVDGAKELTFEYEGWRIRCALLLATDGKEYIVREEYRKLSNRKTATTPRIRDFELDAVLNAQAGVSPWTKKLTGNPNPNPLQALTNQLAHTSGFTGTVWTRSDGAEARLDRGAISLILELPQARKHENQLKAIKEQEAKRTVPKF